MRRPPHLSLLSSVLDRRSYTQKAMAFQNTTILPQLRAGEAVGIPTETVYGLAANALSADAVSKIFQAKNRPQDNPLIVHVSSLAMLQSILPEGELPEIYRPMVERFWPGPLTIVLPSSPKIPSSVTCGQPTVAVRFPSHPVARALIDACGFPLAAPSANASGKPSTTLAQHVYDDLNGRIPLILDGGPCRVGVESTVLDGLRQPPAILRPGGVTYEALLPYLPGLQVYRKHFVDKALEEAPTTPGMKYRHYSPDAPVVLIDAASDFEHRWREIQQSDFTLAKRIGLLTTTAPAPEQQDSGNIERVVMGKSTEEVARDLFRSLRTLDQKKVDVIFVQGVSETDEGMAVMNRLLKAASQVCT
ncbi:DHBP synthase RibB-like alpha/beta domain-containing protein [Dichotomocladium elegans]|nr:DHBP synthase RibB-like alpha/beta domain-containing protein [Dichotomocladium elegans]